MKDERNLHQISDSGPVLHWGASTHVGNVRIQNQDFYGTSNTLIVVADGMGGHNGGEIASEVATREVLSKPKLSSIQELAKQVKRANQAVRDRAQENPTLAGMGTTLCALAQTVDPNSLNKLAVVNVGDSRVYVLANGELHQITQDHSLVETMRREGKLTEFEARNHPNRNVITRSIGTHGEVDVDCWELPARIGDRYLLCTDGLTNEIADEDIKETLMMVTDPQETAEQLVIAAINAEGLDNVTAVVIDIKEGIRETTPLKIPEKVTISRDEIPEIKDEDQKKPIVEKIQLRNALRSDPSRAVKALIGLLVALFAVGSLIGHYAREGFYISFEIRENVDLTESQVVIFKGTKGGVLWFQPTVERWTSILGLDLTEDQRTKIEKGIDFRTVNEAQKYLDGILDENTSAQDASD